MSRSKSRQTECSWKFLLQNILKRKYLKSLINNNNNITSWLLCFLTYITQLGLTPLYLVICQSQTLWTLAMSLLGHRIKQCPLAVITAPGQAFKYWSKIQCHHCGSLIILSWSRYQRADLLRCKELFCNTQITYRHLECSFFPVCPGDLCLT